MPYSFGKPALNCCGGSLSTFGNMKRPVAARAAAVAAENAPHASPIQARRVNSGDVSSGSLVVAAAVAGLPASGVAALAAAPPAEATVVVLPARLGARRAGVVQGLAAHVPQEQRQPGLRSEQHSPAAPGRPLYRPRSHLVMHRRVWCRQP